MADPVSTGLGAASLAIQLLDGVVKGYGFLLAAGNMPAEALELRTRLQMEYQRLLGWSEVTGLIEYESEQDFPDVLKADKLVLVAILSQLRNLMDEFATLNGRYEQLRPKAEEANGFQGNGLDLVEQFASISIRYERKATKRKHLRGTNHVLAMVKKVDEIATDPKRLWWVAFDRDVFKELLRKLSEYNDYLYELMHGYEARKLEETTRKTYLEMLQVRSSVDELKSLVMAAMLFGEHGSGHSSSISAQRHNDRTLSTLAAFKTYTLANDASAADKPPLYEDIIKQPSLDYASISYNPKAADPPSNAARTRVKGVYTENGKDVAVFIEWKAYKSELRADRRGSPQSFPAEGNVTRVKELTGLLKNSNVPEFRIPYCFGYFDDREDKPNSENPDRFGIVFKQAHQDPDAPAPISLLEAFAEPCPSLSARVVLAHKVATSLLYLHAVKWLHKGLRSDAIIFFQDPTTKEVDYSEPLLSGFEYARPDSDGIQSTGGSQDPLAELYVHPNYQGGNAKGTYRKTFDVYSLGILLLEIAYWKPVQEIVGIANKEHPKPQELGAIRGKILDEPAGFLKKVSARAGGRYRIALESCIKGLEAFGLNNGVNEMDPEVGATLQRQFTAKVVENLGLIVL